MNILIIDDDELVAGYFSRTVLIERPKAIVYTAIDDLSAEINLKANRFDLVFCDAYLSNGLSSAEILRKCQDELKQAKIVMLSTGGDIADLCFSLRSDGLPIATWQNKPIYSQDLKRILHQIGL